MEKRVDIETVYASDDNMTFIMEYCYEDGLPMDVNVVGFYYGEPNEEKTRDYFITHQNRK